MNEFCKHKYVDGRLDGSNLSSLDWKTPADAFVGNRVLDSVKMTEQQFFASQGQAEFDPRKIQKTFLSQNHAQTEGYEYRIW